MDKRLVDILNEDGVKQYKCGPLRQNKRKFPWFKIFKWIFLILFWAVMALSIYVLTVFLQMPSFNTILVQDRKPSVIFLDNAGKKIGGINDTFGMTSDVSELPPYVWQAIIAIEDKRFFDHNGLDYYGLMRAGFTNLFAGRTVQGGSTITQQVSKNIFLYRKRDLNRKLMEIILSKMLENRFTKDQILNLYMNRVSLTGGKYGLESASYEIFGKSLKELKIWESASLAGMLKAPTTYNPYRNVEANITRTKVVLKEMYNQKYITQTQYEKALSEIRFEKMEGNETYRYFTDIALIELKSLIGNTDKDVIVKTTLNSNLQKKAQKVLTQELQNSKLEGAIVALDNNGYVLALVGGKDYFKSQFNRAYQAKRQVGSAFKPFVYLAGFENGMDLQDEVFDEPIDIDGWSPKNYNNQYQGKVSLLYAFAQSINTIPVKITQSVGLKNVINTAKKMGMVSDLRYDMSIVLGSNEITLFDLTVAYVPFANGGYGIMPTLITEVVSDNKIIWEKRDGMRYQLIDNNSYKNMRILLHEVITTGTGKRAYYQGLNGGKTGTSSENKDVWFIGFDNKITGGVWVGNDDSSPIGSDSTGGKIPAVIFKKVFE